MSYRDPKTGRWAAKPFEPVKVFVYGTLKRGYGLNHMLRDCEFVGQGVTERRYRMIHVGYPVIMEDGDGHPVTGELYVVGDPYTLARLDAVEGAYNRTPVTVTLEHSAPVECYIYEGKNHYWSRHFSAGSFMPPNDRNELEWQDERRRAALREPAFGEQHD